MSDNMMAEITGGWTIPFGKHKGHSLGCIAFEDAQYIVWLAKQDWVPEKYPEITAFIEAIAVSVVCPGTLDGVACPRTVLPCGFCWAHARAHDDGRSLDLFTCAAVRASDGERCRNTARHGDYCGTHKHLVGAENA
jgi:uncharacterized protein (DUF3820 family)